MLRCVIVDDEPLARECVVNYVNEVEFLTSVGTGKNPLDLAALLQTQNVDLIFLDIQMPMMNGLDFLKMTADLPMVIITTAYPSYALEGFQLDVLDYLVKPITFDRFFKAVTKARDYYDLLARSKSGGDRIHSNEDHFFVKCDYRYERIYYDDILFVQGLQNYVTIHTVKGKFVALMSLKKVEENLDPLLFMRVHKSFIVAVAKIDAIENNDIMIQSTRINISRTYRDEVIERVVNKRLWKKD